MDPELVKISKFELVRRYIELDKESHPLEKERLESAIRMRLKISAAHPFESPRVQMRLRQMLKNGPAAKRFLDIFAWVAIGYGALSVLASIFNVAFFYIFPFERIIAQYQSAFPEQGSFFEFYEILPGLLIYSFVYYGSLLILGIGMLKRLSWARPGMLAFLIFAAISTIAMPFIINFDTFMFLPEYNEEMAQILSMMRIFYYIFLSFFVLIFLALYTWLYYRMNKPDIKEEFEHPYKWEGFYRNTH